MNVLMTGNRGYIGSVMTEVFANAGHKVFGMDSGIFRRFMIEDRSTSLTQQKDIRDASVFDLRGIDAIVHLAALSNDPMSEINESVTLDINLLATIRLAHAAKFAGVKRFLFSSSCSVYGSGAMSEDGTLYPISTYAQSKLMSEGALSKMADSNFSPVFLRNGTAYGVSPSFRSDLVLNAMVLDAYQKGVVKVFGDGTLWRPVVHVDDISQAFLLALEAPKEVVHNQIFNVGSNKENYQVKTIASAVKNTVPETRIENIESSGDSRSYQVEFSKIEDKLGFSAKWDLVSGARQLYHFYKFFKFNSDFVRLKQIKELKKQGILNDNMRMVYNG